MSFSRTSSSPSRPGPPPAMRHLPEGLAGPAKKGSNPKAWFRHCTTGAQGPATTSDSTRPLLERPLAPERERRIKEIDLPGRRGAEAEEDRHQDGGGSDGDAAR